MKKFLDNNFILETETAQILYHEYAKNLSIIDYHCHLSPKLIVEDYQYNNLGEIWLTNDHYKWRVMRANGIDERFCTGKDTTDWEKFQKWAETVPYTMGNPLYHWTHLELKTTFGITKLLSPNTAKEIFDVCTAKLSLPEFSVQNIIKKYNVETLCTTDDPIDTLEYHLALQKGDFSVKILPTWRPDKAMAVENTGEFRKYVEKLSETTGITISSYSDYLLALQNRHDFFAQSDCKSADFGIEEFYSEDYTQNEISHIFNKVYAGNELSPIETIKFKSAVLYENTLMNWEKGWVQQFHYGVLRNNNTRMYNQLGKDIGCDSIGDFAVAKNIAKFLDRLDKTNQLAKTIIYNLNPRDNELIATMIGNFQGSGIPGKIQLGSAWWFSDQKEGIESQIKTLSNYGLLSRFVGMVTDSRSFLSYSRHEYFRRILCNFVGNEVEKGLLPSSEIPFIGGLIERICYYNAKNYFQFT